MTHHIASVAGCDQIFSDGRGEDLWSGGRMKSFLQPKVCIRGCCVRKADAGEEVALHLHEAA